MVPLGLVGRNLSGGRRGQLARKNPVVGILDFGFWILDRAAIRRAVTIFLVTGCVPVIAQQPERGGPAKKEATEAKPSPTPLARTMSDSGQFVIYGGSSAVRLAVARTGEALRKGWALETGVPEAWKWPVIVNLLPPAGSRSAAPSTSLFIGDGDTAKVQIDAPANLAGSPQLEIEIVRALALESAHREQIPQPGKPYQQPPEWLVEGAWQKIFADREALPPRLFDRLVESGPPPKLEAFIRQRPAAMDSTSRAIYRAQAMALLAAFASTPESLKGVAAYIGGLSKTRPEDAKALLAAFPSLEADPAKLVKLWTLSLARASAADRADSLPAAETESQLAQILDSISLPEDPKKDAAKDPKKSGPPPAGAGALPELAKTKEGRFLVARVAKRLMRLETRAHPLYRPVVSEFREVASALAVKPRRDAPKRIAAAGELRAALAGRTTAVADYMNWFEASQLESLPEGAPDLAAGLPEVGAPPRRDAISAALDAAQKEFRQ